MSFLYTEYNYEDELRVTRDEGIAEGLSMGEKKGQQEFIHRMRDNGLSIKDISKYLGISENEVRRA